MIEDIFKFNQEIVGLQRTQVNKLRPEEYNWLIQAITEELDELDDAIVAKNLPDQVDALIDLAYFAIGGLVRLGLSVEQARACFNAVHSSNMTKAAGKKESRTGAQDAIKPKSFQDPQTTIRMILFKETDDA